MKLHLNKNAEECVRWMNKQQRSEEVKELESVLKISQTS